MTTISPSVRICDECHKVCDISIDPHAQDGWMWKDGKDTCPDCQNQQAIEDAAQRGS